MPDELSLLDATAQAELVRSGQATPAELVETAIARIERLDGELNAVVSRVFDAARAAARSPLVGQRPFAGVPFLMKDIGATQAGVSSCSGNRRLRDLNRPATADTPLGTRFRNAGLVTLGTSNVPEFGSGPATQSLAYGPCRNPWDPSRSPSGSSGGSAAAVAAGLVPIAHANDGGGSIRLPASWCGLVGLKPSRGRVPGPGSISRLVAELVVSRSVRDTAAVLDAVHGATAADLYRAPAYTARYVDELERHPGRLRIGLLTHGGEVATDEECADAARRAATTLESLGHGVEPVEPDTLFQADPRAQAVLFTIGTANSVHAVAEAIGRDVTADDIEPYNWAAMERVRRMTAEEVMLAQEAQQAWTVRTMGLWDRIDILCTPTSGCAPLPIEDLDPPADKPGRIGRLFGRIARFTLPFNVTGQPAISLPLHWAPGGLPVGVQLVAAMGREDLLLRVAAQLEQATPWAHRLPMVHASR